MRCLILCVPMALLACGGGGTSGSGGTAPNSSNTLPSPEAASNLPRLFAGLTAAVATPETTAYLKACYFQAKKTGTKGQGGIDFLESLTIDVLPGETAPLYDATTGLVVAKSSRAYKGTNGKMGAPARLWTGVIKLDANGGASGFGYPCTPTSSMLTAPPSTCYWLVDNYKGAPAALNYYDSIGDGAPITNTAGVPTGNIGWGTGTAYYFWYEMGLGATCSAPESTTLWRRVVRCADLSQTACNT